jgi:hypothetical protein
MHIVPGLPRRLAEPTPVVLAGTLLWFAGVAGFGIVGWATGTVSIQFWTSLAGFTLGVMGYGVFRWQRSASRRGARGAWKGLSGLDD